MPADTEQARTAAAHEAAQAHGGQAMPAAAAQHGPPAAPAQAAAQPDKWTALRYFVVSQIGWFACVLSAAHGHPAWGVAVTAVIVAWHLRRVPRPALEARVVLAAMAIGAVWESGLCDFGLLVYPNGILIPGTAPYWMLALWALFALTLNTTFRWLHGRVLLGAVLGAVCGPLSFSAGARLGAVQFHPPLLALTALALGWAVLIPGLVAIAQHWDGSRS
jgi:hypothetical protein